MMKKSQISNKKIIKDVKDVKSELFSKITAHINTLISQEAKILYRQLVS